MHKFHLKAPYLLKKEISEIYIMNAIRAFALSMIAIFIPIFLLEKGFSLIEVAFFFIVKSVSAFVACYYGLKLASRYGAKHVIFASVPVLIIYFLFLYNLDKFIGVMNDYVLITLLSVLQMVAMALFYMGFHIEFAKFSEAKNSVKQLGIINILSTIVSAIGPLIGAVIITNYSFNLLFLLIIFLLILSLIPLMFSREIHEEFNFDIKKIWSLRKNKKIIPFLAEGVRDLAGRTLWPILLFFLFTSLNHIGFIYAISNTILVIFTLYIGKIATDHNKHKILRIGTYIHAASMVIRTLVKTFATIAVVQGFGGLSWTMVNLSFSSMFYNNSKKEGIAYYIYFRELFLHAGRIIMAILLIILLQFFEISTSLIIAIIIGALTMLFMPMIVEEK